MVFVRKVRTGSGATAVQVVQKRHGKFEIIKHVGSGHSPVEVALLVRRGREILQGEQEALDLGMAPVADTALACAAKQQPALLPDSSPPAVATALKGQGVQVARALT